MASMSACGLASQVSSSAAALLARRRSATWAKLSAAAGDGLPDGVLEVGVAFEAQLLAELDHAGLADAQRAGQLLGGVVAQKVGVVENEIRDAAFDRRHVVTLGADFHQGRHGHEVRTTAAA
jgi:hypothetical protein